MKISRKKMIKKGLASLLVLVLLLSVVPFSALTLAAPNSYGFTFPFRGYTLSSVNISSPYGWRLIGTKWDNHEAIDMWVTKPGTTSARGLEIYAVLPGIVKEAGYRGSYGYQVLIEHDNGLFTRYAHMNEIPWVSLGQRVTQNDVLGVVGSSGTNSDGTPSATGPHLHFEVCVGSQNNKVNPTPYLTGAGDPEMPPDPEIPPEIEEYIQLGRAVAGDFNGDGFEDYAVMYDYGIVGGQGKAEIHTFFSNGSTFSSNPTHTYINSYNANMVTGKIIKP